MTECPRCDQEALDDHCDGCTWVRCEACGTTIDPEAWRAFDKAGPVAL